MEDFKYPIGKFVQRDSYAASEIADCISRIESLPARLRLALTKFSDKQFDTPYRDGGWTVRQLVHHIADSHLNAYIRIKWTLTEASPTVKAYNEKLWATTPEVQGDPSISLDVISAHHRKWVSLLKQLSPTDFEKHFVHPDTGKEVKLKNLIALYAWHGDHHLAHVAKLKERLGW